MERLVSPQLVGNVAGRMVGVFCPVDPAATSLGRCRVIRGLPLPDAREREHCSMAGCLKLAARWPDVPVHDARKADPFFFGDDEPRPPGDDWLHIVGRLHSASTLSGSAGSLSGASFGACDGSRGTGSSSGSTVYVRSGSPISTALSWSRRYHLRQGFLLVRARTLCERDVRLRRVRPRSGVGRAISGAADASGGQLRSRWTDGAPRRGSR